MALINIAVRKDIERAETALAKTEKTILQLGQKHRAGSPRKIVTSALAALVRFAGS